MSAKGTAKKDKVLLANVHVRDGDTYETVFLPAGTVVGKYADQVHDSRLITAQEFEKAQENTPEPSSSPKPVEKKKPIKKSEPEPEYDFGTE